MSSQQTLYPNADGDMTGFPTVYPSSPATHFDKVDETPNDADTTYIQSNSKNLKTDLFTTPGYVGGGVVNWVRVYYISRGQTAGYYYPRAAIKTHGTVYYEAARTINSVTSYTEYYKEWALNPYTANPWTWEEICDAQIGVAVTSPGSNNYRFTQVRMVVDHSPKPCIGNVGIGAGCMVF